LVVENTMRPDAPSFRIGNEPVESSTVWSSVQVEEEFRILPTAVTERFCKRADGQVKPVASGSIRPMQSVLKATTRIGSLNWPDMSACRDKGHPICYHRRKIYRRGSSRKRQPYSKKIAHRSIWVEPSLLAEIEYRAKSAEGKVRHPSRRAAEAKTLIGNVNYGAIVLDPVDGLATDASYLRDLTNPVWTACWTPKCRSRLPRAFDPRPAALPRRTRSSAQNSP
jgi:hypothetical protein